MYQLIKSVLVMFSVAVMTGCAFSPQQITINPVIDTAAEEYGRGKSVAVQVVDNRENKVLGSRGGVYKDTSIISLANSLTDAVGRAAEARLAVQGFNVNSADPQAQITIGIEKLIYNLPEQKVGKKVQLESVASIEVKAGLETYTGSYKLNTERQTVITPSMKANEEMINTLLSATLERLFADPKLKAFLSKL